MMDRVIVLINLCSSREKVFHSCFIANVSSFGLSVYNCRRMQRMHLGSYFYLELSQRTSIIGLINHQ